MTPREQPHRRIPFHVREDVEKELKRLEKLDIIETVEGPTPWISPIVVVPKKSGEVRICVDMRLCLQVDTSSLRLLSVAMSVYIKYRISRYYIGYIVW